MLRWFYEVLTKSTLGALGADRQHKLTLKAREFNTPLHIVLDSERPPKPTASTQSLGEEMICGGGGARDNVARGRHPAAALPPSGTAAEMHHRRSHSIITTRKGSAPMHACLFGAQVMTLRHVLRAAGAACAVAAALAGRAAWARGVAHPNASAGRDRAGCLHNARADFGRHDRDGRHGGGQLRTTRLSARCPTSSALIIWAFALNCVIRMST